MRLLVWLVLAVIVYLAMRSKVRAMQQNMRDAANREFDVKGANADRIRPAIPVEDMVACAHCHVYLPASEAVHLVTPASEQFFCSEEHLKMHSNEKSSSDNASSV